MMINKIIFAFSNFVIKKGCYLIPAPPIKPSISAMRTFSAFQKQIKENSLHTTNPQLFQEKYKQIAEITKEMENYQKQIQEYNKKYLHPLRRYKLFTYFVGQYYKDPQNKQKLTPVTEVGKIVKKQLTMMSPTDHENQKKKIQLINQQNIKQSARFKIPIDQFKSLNKFILDRSGKTQTLRSCTPQIKQKYQKEYENYLKQLQSKRQAFAKQHNIQITQLNRLISQQKKSVSKSRSSKKIKAIKQ